MTVCLNHFGLLFVQFGLFSCVYPTVCAPRAMLVFVDISRVGQNHIYTPYIW